MSDAPQPGTIVWRDLTVADAETMRDYYAAVVGWRAEPVDMGGYADFSMVAPATGETVAGVCHARDSNADLPPQWLMYVAVADLDAAVAACLAHAGDVVTGPRSLAGGRFAVLRDPAGAVLAVYEAPSSSPNEE